MDLMSSARLALRELKLDDAGFILRLVNDSAWLRYIGDRGVRTLDHARAFIVDGPQAMYAMHGHGLYLVESLPQREPLGLCGLLRRDGLPAVDLGFAFLPECRGKGYAHEAAALVLGHAREVLGLPTVLAITLADNSSSIGLLERLDFRHRGPVQLHSDGPVLELYAWTG